MGALIFSPEFEEVCATNEILDFVLPSRASVSLPVDRFNRTSRDQYWKCSDGDFTIAAVTPA